MINVVRNIPAPAELAQNKIGAETKEALLQMFHGKCYLCEIKNAVSTEVEHFKPKSLFAELKYDWNNLFLACHHCNTIKNYTTDKHKDKELLNCCDDSVSVIELINFSCSANPKEKVTISATLANPDPITTHTILLLDQIFNTDSPSKKFDAKQLTDKVTIEVKKLLDLLHQYTFDSYSTDTKASILRSIKNLLHPASEFTAFKVSYIKKYYSDEPDIFGCLT